MKKYVKYLIITLVVGIMIAIGTYAYWSYESSNKKNISIQTSRELSNYIIYDEGESKFAGELKIGSSYSDGVHTTISIKKTNDASNLELIATVNMTVNAIGDNIKNSYGLKWAITKGDSTSAGTLLNQGNFYGKNNDDVIELKTGIEVTTTEEKYTVWIWIDGSENIDPKIVGETLDTSVWTQVDQILDNRFEVTSINSNYQFINASAVNTTKNIVAYAVTNTSSQPSSYTNLTTQEQGNVYNVVDYKVTNTGTYYVWFKDSAGNTVNKSVAVSKIDTTPPVCTFGNFEPSTIKNGETSVVELTCVDEEIGIKSSDITSSSITLNGNSATLNSNIEKTRIANGFKYKLTVTGTSTDGDTSLSLNTGVVNNKAGLSNSASSSTPTVKVQNITNVAIPIQSGTLTYNSTSQTVTWSNYDSSKMTVSGTTSATNAGTYSATFTLKDTTKYRWSDGTSTAKTVSWTINQYNISNVDVGSISDQTYTGSSITPVPVLSKILNGSSKYTLVKDTDYTLSYSNNTNVGTATITATGKGNFTGTKNVTFKIVAKSIAIPSQSGTLTYNTASQSPSWSNYDSTKMTVSGTTSATNAGTYSATFTLKDTTNYKWSDGTTTEKTVSWKINQYNISNVDVGSISDQTYTGSAITPAPVLSKILNGSSKYTLVKDTDYTLSYSNNKNAGTATITATGKGNFTGTKNVTFKIVAKSIAIPMQSGTLTYNGTSQTVTWYHYDSSKMTVSGTTSATNAGTYSATFTLKDTTNYRWSEGTSAAITVYWKIDKYNISNVDVGSISDQAYTGSAITPVPVLSKILNGSSKYTLVKDTDYTLSYSNNTNVGTATITATGKGNFTGTKIITFNIVQIKVYQNIFNSFSDYTVSGNNASISYNAGINEYTFNNTSTSDPYAEISQKAYLTANTPYTIHADFKTTDGTKITGSSNIFQIFYRTQSGGYSEANSVRLSPSNNTVTFEPSSTGYYYFRFDNDYGNNMIIYNFSIGFTKDITYGKTYGNLTSGSQIVGSNTELFAGWYTETSYTNKVTSTTTVTNINSHVLFAKWKLYGKFNYWNGSSIASTYSTCELTSGSTCTLSVPSAVSGSKPKNNSSYAGVSTSTSSMTASSLTISRNQTYYAYYSATISNKYYKGTNNSNDYDHQTEWGTRSLYKNVFFTSGSALSYVISDSKTGTTNLSHGTGMGGAAFKGFSSDKLNYMTMGTAAESTNAVLYSVYNIWYNASKSAYYNSLSTAVQGATAGNTLTLNASYLEDYEKTVINKKIYLVISSGKTVEFSNYLGDIPIAIRDSGGTITAGDLYLSGSGTLKSNNERTIYNYGGVLQCESVKFTGSAIHISSTSGTVKLGTSSGTNGCSITKTSTTNSLSAIAIAGGTAYMYAGTIDSAGYGIYVQDAGTVNVYGGSITSTDSAIYSAAGSSGYIRIGRAFSDNTTLNPNGIANTAKNRYSGLGKKSNVTNPKIIVDGTGKPAINIYSTSSSANNAYLRINHGYIEAKSTVVSISSNAKNTAYIDGGALYSSNSHVYHNQSTSVVTALTGSAHLYSDGYSTVNSVYTIRINTSTNETYNGVEESRSDCSDSEDTGLGRYYGTYIMSKSSYGIYSSNDSAIGVSVGDSTYTQGSKSCDKFRNEGATIASYKSVFVGKMNLYWYAGSAYHNSAGSTNYAGDSVTKKTKDTTRLHSKNNAITTATISFSFNGTTRSVSVNRRSYPYQTELTKAFGSEVTTVTRTSGTVYAWRSGSSCTSYSVCGSGSCNSVGVVKSEWNIYVISKSSYSNLYYAWVPITSNAWGDKYPGYHILAKDGHAAISTCAGLQTPITFSSYVTTTYNNRTYAKVIMPLKNGSTCYVSDCSNLPS